MFFAAFASLVTAGVVHIQNNPPDNRGFGEKEHKEMVEMAKKNRHMFRFLPKDKPVTKDDLPQTNIVRQVRSISEKNGMECRNLVGFHFCFMFDSRIDIVHVMALVPASVHKFSEEKLNELCGIVRNVFEASPLSTQFVYNKQVAYFSMQEGTPGDAGLICQEAYKFRDGSPMWKFSAK